jgi:hypothetical protein
MPNVEGLPAGRVTEFYSFDHDLGHFVSIGPGTVSDDGTVVTSNVGVGIVKAGWHCDGSPQATGSPNACPTCTYCTGSQCAPQGRCLSCGNAGSGTACDGMGHCLTGPALLQFPDVIASLGLVIGPKQPIGRTGDPQGIVNCPLSPLNSCFVAVREDLGPITTSCDSVSFKGAIMTETETSVGFGCPGLNVRTGSGCRVGDGNQLMSFSGGPCQDTHSICGAPPFPAPLPGPDDPPDLCLIIDTQTLSLNGVPFLVRHISYSISVTASGCAVVIH